MLLLLLFGSLNIIYTAGIGGEFMGCGCVGQEGGIARIAAYIKTTPHEILLDAGGIFGKNRFVDSIALVYLNDYYYDAVAVSPNELRFGPEFIAYMSTVSPLICSNVKYRGKPIAREFLIKRYNDVKVLITATIDTGLVVKGEGIEIFEPQKIIARIKSLPETKDYDVHLNIDNGRSRKLTLEKMGSVSANWIRRIGLIKIADKKYENITTILDSTIPEDELTRKRIAGVLNYLHNLPAREVITEFPAKVVLHYFYDDEGDTLMRMFFPLLTRTYSGMLSVRYVKSDSQPYVGIGGGRIENDPELARVLHEKIAAILEGGGDDNIQVVYFPNLNCPECQRYSMLLKAYGAEKPDIKIAEVEDEVLLQKFYAIYGVPEEKRQKPVIFIGRRYLLQGDISSDNLNLEGRIPWLEIYGVK